MTVIARIIAEKLRAFLFDTASLCTPNSDRHSIDSIKEREFWNLFHDSFHIFFISGVFIIIYQILLKIFFLIFSQNLVEICEKLARNSIIKILFRANMERKKWYTQRVRYRHYFEDTRNPWFRGLCERSSRPPLFFRSTQGWLNDRLWHFAHFRLVHTLYERGSCASRMSSDSTCRSILASPQFSFQIRVREERRYNMRVM